MKNLRSHPLTRPSGFSLVEVIVALGIFAIAITALMGVIPFGMKQVQTAANESFSMTTMEGIRDDLAVALAAKMIQSPRYGLKPPAAGSSTPVDFKIQDNGELAAADEAARVRIVGSLLSPSPDTPGPLQLHLRAVWPAKAPAGRESGALELVAAFQP